MMVVDLSEQEWQAIIACMAYAPARESVLLMNKIGAQIQKQQQHKPTNSGEMPINIGEIGGVKQ